MGEEEKRMTQGQKDAIKVLLFAQQAALNSLVVFLARKFKFLSEIDNVDFIEEYLSTHILTQLGNVEKALENINSKDFGICGACHEPIPFERLMAMPTAAHCVQCAAENDRRLRNMRDLLRRNPTPRSLILSF